ncbi:hypothetical protein [Xanthomonas maliensis]|uniref:hypothetical protein n=1 Tax=Xanthomonas maliensis TaxID=1321368 RepID=UPI00039C5C3C|nr:hypothetical protein [Xanthomonas maliensis]
MNRLAVAALLLGLAARALAGSSDAAAPPICVEVQIGQHRSGQLSCLNQQLRDSVARARAVPSATAPPVAGTPIALGQPTPAALRQRYGQAYGQSLQPQRPPAPQYASPFAPTR